MPGQTRSRIRNGLFILERQLQRLEVLLSSTSHAKLLATKDVDFETSEDGLVFVVEKPGTWTRSKFLELRSNLSDGRLTLANLERTGHATKEQFKTQFSGCFVVAKTSRRGRFNFVPFEV